MLKRSTPPRNALWQAALYIVLLACAIAAMVALSRCDKPVASSAVTSSGGDTLDVAIEYSPVTFYTYADTLGGYDYDLLRLVSAEARRPVKFHPIVTLQRGLDGLASGAYDLLVAQFPTTTQNKARYIFTDPIYIDQQVLVQHRPALVHTQLDLAGDTVHVVKGSPMVERIAGLSREIGDTIHTVVDDTYGPEQLVMLVASGDIRLAVVNKGIAQALAKQCPEIDVSLDISLSQFQSWTLARDRVALRDSLNAWLTRVRADGRVTRQLEQRYLAR